MCVKWTVVIAAPQGDSSTHSKPTFSLEYSQSGNSTHQTFPSTHNSCSSTSRSRTTRHLNFSSRESPFLSESHPPPSSCQCQLLCLAQAACLTNPGQTLTHPGQTTLINIRPFPGTSSYFISHPFYFLSSSFFQRHVCSPSKLLQLCFSFISS